MKHFILLLLAAISIGGISAHIRIREIFSPIKLTLANNYSLCTGQLIFFFHTLVKITQVLSK